ncbi:MAG: dihydrolipoamide acetyltransferase family protein [archaeon]
MYSFKFPDVGEGITEGTIVKWRIKEGDVVKADEVIADIETDKAIVEIPCPLNGKAFKICHKEGDVIKVGEVLVDIDDGSAPASQVDSTKTDASNAAPPKPEEHYTGSVVGFLEEAKEDNVSKDGPHREAQKITSTSPKIRALAKKLNLNLDEVRGTGEAGRVTEDDIQKTLGEKGEIELIPLKGLRKTIADNMTLSQQNTVTVTNMQDVEVTRLIDVRNIQKIAAENKGVKLTFLPYILKATVIALKNNPLINSSIDGENIIIKKQYNIGVAVDTDDGLFVPVIKNAEKMGVLEFAQAVSLLADKARKRQLTLEELKGGTFTISNLGSLGVKYFTPVINYPEAAILGIGTMFDELAIVDGRTVTKKIMPVSLSYDHRIIDGASASRFLKDFALVIEEADYKV